MWFNIFSNNNFFRGSYTKYNQEISTDNYFLKQKPDNDFLSSLVDYYFYIDVAISELSVNQEFIIPFPRVTFGYFFNHPFLVTNHTVNKSASVNMAISRISSDKITVNPQSERIQIIGAHVQPFTLAYLTKEPIHSMPWLISTMDLFKNIADDFKNQIEKCGSPQQMFSEVEKVFLNNLLVRDGLELIIKAIKLIEERQGNIQLKEIANQLSVSDKTIRHHFYNNIGCSPKEYIRLVKLKQTIYQMSFSQNSLTKIAYDNNYFDQAHLIHEVKSLTGKIPNKLRKEMPNFRFLQF